MNHSTVKVQASVQLIIAIRDWKTERFQMIKMTGMIEQIDQK